MLLTGVCALCCFQAAQAVLIALFQLNTPEFTMLLGALPKTFQDGATKLLQNHLRNTGNTAQVHPAAWMHPSCFLHEMATKVPAVGVFCIFWYEDRIGSRYQGSVEGLKSPAVVHFLLIKATRPTKQCAFKFV